VGPSRWPVHPAPIDGEALSSWLRRISRIYGCGVADLLKYDLGFAEVEFRALDMKAPRELLITIAARTNFPVQSIKRMTFPEAVPFLFRTPYTDSANDEFENWSVLFEPSRLHSYEKLTQWFRKQTMSTVHGCRQCLADYPDGGVLLGWMLKVVLSCPIHGVMLEPGRNV
jgi:hypothetical protein